MSPLAKHSLATSVIHQEGHNCGSCNELIGAQQHGYLIQIARCYVENGVTTIVPPVDKDGDPEFVSYFFHEKCWEEVIEALVDVNEDVPPSVIQGTISGECAGCSSHILPGELCGIIYEGSAELSDFCPNGDWALDWRVSDTHMLCSVCLNEININTLEGLWGDTHYIKQGNECERGVAHRCWRYGECVPGHCHMDDVEGG